VRAEDRADAVDQPRGKQDWREEPHGIWYERTTGIWQTVWLETVPREHVVDLAWTSDLPAGVVRGELTLSRTPASARTVEVTVRLGEEVLARTSVSTAGAAVDVLVPVPALRNGQDRARLLWSPESPTLLDVELTVREEASGQEVDTVASYLGLRSAGVGGGAFELNGQPYYVRSVLDQGYRPETHLATTGTEELRTEVQRIKAMGFNAVRVHQKAEDPRFLFWADVLGLLVWGETAGAYSFSPTAVELLTTEWLALVRRDRSHPCVVTWVPVNESWGVQDIAVSAAQQQFAQSLASLTRALDPSRPVMSNEGWEHVDSDILGVHDYSVDPDELQANYADREAAVATVTGGHGPQGRRPVLTDHQLQTYLSGRAPLMITEFGGISLSQAADSWGYAQTGSAEDYGALLTRLFAALRACPEVVGFCYTQYMDTGQETNGLLYADGTPKLPIGTIREIVTGRPAEEVDEASSTFGWAD
jgi:beta-galactosidase/beta-glucuronidase